MIFFLLFIALTLLAFTCFFAIVRFVGMNHLWLGLQQEEQGPSRIFALVNTYANHLF
jgi:hypothetical protein